ncbi:MAG: hypothetical protein WAN46_11030 [Gammaproteobacteria bacterium]
MDFFLEARAGGDRNGTTLAKRSRHYQENLKRNINLYIGLLFAETINRLVLVDYFIDPKKAQEVHPVDIIKDAPRKEIDPVGKWVTRVFFMLLWSALLYPLWKLVAPA